MVVVGVCVGGVCIIQLGSRHQGSLLVLPGGKLDMGFLRGISKASVGHTFPILYGAWAWPSHTAEPGAPLCIPNTLMVFDTTYTFELKSHIFPSKEITLACLDASNTEGGQGQATPQELPSEES